MSASQDLVGRATSRIVEEHSLSPVPSQIASGYWLRPCGEVVRIRPMNGLPYLDTLHHAEATYLASAIAVSKWRRLHQQSPFKFSDECPFNLMEVAMKLAQQSTPPTVRNLVDHIRELEGELRQANRVRDQIHAMTRSES